MLESSASPAAMTSAVRADEPDADAVDADAGDADAGDADAGDADAVDADAVDADAGRGGDGMHLLAALLADSSAVSSEQSGRGGPAALPGTLDTAAAGPDGHAPAEAPPGDPAAASPPAPSVPFVLAARPAVEAAPAVDDGSPTRREATALPSAVLPEDDAPDTGAAPLDHGAGAHPGPSARDDPSARDEARASTEGLPDDGARPEDMAGTPESDAGAVAGDAPLMDSVIALPDLSGTVASGDGADLDEAFFRHIAGAPAVSSERAGAAADVDGPRRRRRAGPASARRGRGAAARIR